MIVLSPSRMKRYDDYAIGTWGIPSAVLMENAGRSTYRLLRRDYLQERGRLLVCCGRGNNGGDGFVIARYALRDGFDTRVLLLADPKDLKGDARLNMELYRSLGGFMAGTGDGAEGARELLRNCDVVVDAIFGTGLSKAVDGPDKSVIEAINGSGRPVIAVDIPSGLDGLRGVPLGTAVKATHTYTYGHLKLGQSFYPGVSYCGRLTVVDISLPQSAQDEIGIDAHLVDGGMLRASYRTRAAEAHKGMFGNLAVIAGSTGKTGAATMTSLSALRIGAGLVTLVTPASLNPVVGAKLTEAMTYPVDDLGRGFLPLSSFEEIREFVVDKDVIILGPGLGRADETAALVRRLYTELDKVFVIDADGINAFEGHSDLIRENGEKAIFTPHPGEFGRLIGMSPKEVNADRLDVGRRFAERNTVNLVLKGAPTITFSPEGEAYINPTGNPSLSKGGAGDVLTGVIGGLVGQGYSMVGAAIFGVYIHGYVADRWVEERTELDLLAGDLISGIGGAVRDIKNGTDRVYIEESF